VDVCGRFTLTVSAGLLAELFDLDGVPDVPPRYNIAPTQSVLIVRAAPDLGREAAAAHWGLIPSWAKDAKIGARMINARGETVASKPSFRNAVRTRRCLVAADGFYEWQRLGDGKQPHHIRFSDRRPFAFAGLWERWRDGRDQSVDSCTIITTRANDVVAPIHDRMPVILHRDRFTEWLEPRQLPTDRLESLLVPYPPDQMEAVAVGTHVNNPRNEDPKCIELLT